MTLFRGFIAIDLDVSSKIVELENEIKKIDAPVKLVEPKNVHLTLKFLGDTDERLIDEIEKIIKESIKGIKPFKIKLEGTGVFPNQNYIKIIWIGIKNGEQITPIAEKIDGEISKLGFKKEKRKFSPHLTIGRVKTAKNKDKLIQIIEEYNEILFSEFEVKSIKLIKSELTPKEPIYTTLKEIKL